VIPCIVQVPTVANTGGNPLSKKVVGAIRMTLGWWIFSAPAIVGTEEGLYESGWPIESLNVDNVKGVVGQTISSLVTLQ
jgi:hypothetical protein